MKGKLIPILCWFFYGALYYTAFNPNHEYLSMLDGARTLYLVIHIPMLILIGLLSLALFFLSGKFDEIAKEGVAKILKENSVDDEGKAKLKKIKEEVSKIEKVGNKDLFTILNRVIWYPVIPVTFIMLGDGFLGSVMLIMAAIALYLVSALKTLSKKVKKELENAGL